MKATPWTPVEDKTLAQGCEIVKDAVAPFDVGSWMEMMGLSRTPQAIRQRIYRRGLDVPAVVRAALQRAHDEGRERAEEDPPSLPPKDACAALGDVAFAVSNDRRLRELDRAYIALAIVTIAEHLKSKLGAAEGPQPEEAS